MSLGGKIPIMRFLRTTTHIDHDQAPRLEDVAADGVEQDLRLEADVDLHCWRINRSNVI